MMLDSVDEELLYCRISKYADDNKLYPVVRDDDDRRRIQNDLDRVFRWSVRWGFDLNVDKCAVIQFGGGKNVAFLP